MPKPTIDKRLADVERRLRRIADYLERNPPKTPTSAASPRLELVVDNAKKRAA